VLLCENPSVVTEAANRLGTATAPLICVNAHPGAAATVLLRRLGAAGSRLRYHGDFDWPGITIANGIMGRFDALPWRLDTDAYRSAAQLGGPVCAAPPSPPPGTPASPRRRYGSASRSRRSESSTTCSPISPTPSRRADPETPAGCWSLAAAPGPARGGGMHRSSVVWLGRVQSRVV
jgi:hypothetical protein